VAVSSPATTVEGRARLSRLQAGGRSDDGQGAAPPPP
jgi:hypothetical protein